MSKLPSTITGWGKISSWIKVHKILTLFAVICIAGGLYLLGSWVVLQVQIHFERRDYLQSRQLINSVVDGVALPGKPVVKKFSDCSYSTNGAVFATRFLGCSTGVDVIYSNISSEEGRRVRNLLRQEILNRGIKLRDNPHGAGEYDLSVDVFSVHGIICGISSTYYDENVPTYVRDGSAPIAGRASLTSLSCGGSAKAEYFPVTKN